MALRESLPFWAVDILWLLIRLAVFGQPPGSRAEISLSTMLLTLPSVLLFYLKQLTWPSNLSPYYNGEYITTTATPEFLVPLVALVALGGFGAYIAWRKPLALSAFGAIWMIATLLPALNLRVLQWLDIQHDRYLYLPSIGFGVLAGLAYKHLADSSLIKRWLVNVVFCSTILLLGASTVLQSLLWASPVVLYTHAAKIAPGSIVPLKLLADELSAKGSVADALRIRRRVLAMSPTWAEEHFIFARECYRERRYEEAEAHFLRVTELDKQNSMAFYWLGRARLALRRPSAVEPLRRALELSQDPLLGLHLALAHALLLEGNTQTAILEIERELAAHPGNAEALELLNVAKRESSPIAP